MKVRDAAARLEVSPATVYSLIASGKLRHYRIGNGRGAIRISEDHLAVFLASAEPVKALPAPAAVRHSKFQHIKIS